MTGPTSEKISLSFSSVASYGILPTESEYKKIYVKTIISKSTLLTKHRS